MCKMHRKTVAASFALVLSSVLSANAAYFNPATDWMPGKVGAFMHYWPTDEMPNATATFDVEGLKKQLLDMKVDFFCLTLGQNSNYYNAPNDVYETKAGHAIGSRCSKRDIPGEIIAALKGTGIRFGLYSPCAPSFNDPTAEKRFGYSSQPPEKKDKNPFMTDEGVANWANVCGEWARRYGTGVSLWWFDGAYERIGFTEKHGEMLAAAVKAANPGMVVSFNCGCADWDPDMKSRYEKACKNDPTLADRMPFREWRACTSSWYKGLPVENHQYLRAADYTPGEIAQPFRFQIAQRWLYGNQAFILTYLGDYWGKHNCRYGDEIWVPFLKEYLKRGGCIAFDMGMTRENGRFNEDQCKQLGRLIHAAK